jgi:probable F420-dependent oxidoreductase
VDVSRKFRFGAVAAYARSGEEWAATARRVEELGFSSLLCPDTTGTLAPFAALSAAATVTSTLRLGTYVLASPLRTPGAVAWETRSLNVLSDGRFELGLGAGRPGSDQDAARLGLPFGSAGERIAQLEAAIDAVRAESDVPILMAGAGPRMLALAARRADTIALGMPPLSTDDDLDAKVRELREIAGERFDGLELNANIALVGEDVPPYAASWFGADPKDLFRVGAITALRGTPREMADTLLRRRDRAGVSYVSVNAMFAEQFAPVVEILSRQS